MAVQLSQPQASYVCGFCSFTSPDHRVLVKHLVNHTVFKEKKHEHMLWCGLCKPLIDANYSDGHQHAIASEDHLMRSVYHNNNDLGYGDTSNYYSGYNELYNPYTFPNAYYYPMNIAYRNPYYGNLNGYYQTQDTMFYADDFYGGTDVSQSPNIKQISENKTPHNWESTQDTNSSSTRSFSNFGIRSNDSNSTSYESSIETFKFDPQSSSENSPGKSPYTESNIHETRTLTKSIANDDLNVLQTNMFGAISNIEPQPDTNKSIQPDADENLPGKLNCNQVKNVSSKEISDPKCNAIERSEFQTDSRKANDKSVSKDLTESSNLELLPEDGSKCIGSPVVDAKSVIKINSTSMNANRSVIISAPNKNYSKLLPVEMAKSSENDVHANVSSTEELVPDSFPEAAHIEKIVIKDASGIENCSIDVKVETRSKNALRKKSYSKLRICERAASENFLCNGSISAEDRNIIPISDAESSPKFNTTILTNSSDVETGSICVNGSPTKIDLNEIHSEQSETSPKILNSISILSENGNVFSDIKLSPKINVRIVPENCVSDIKIQSIGMNRDLKTKKDKEYRSSKVRAYEFKGEIGLKKKDRLQLKIGTYEDVLDENFHGETKGNRTEAITKSSKELDKTAAFSNVEDIQNGCQSDLNHTNNNSRSVPPQYQGRSTYAEVVKRGLPVKSSN